MNISRKFLRIWLTISSMIGFVAGWIFLSHTVETRNRYPCWQYNC